MTEKNLIFLLNEENELKAYHRISPQDQFKLRTEPLKAKDIPGIADNHLQLINNLLFVSTLVVIRHHLDLFQQEVLKEKAGTSNVASLTSASKEYLANATALKKRVKDDKKRETKCDKKLEDYVEFCTEHPLGSIASFQLKDRNSNNTMYKINLDVMLYLVNKKHKSYIIGFKYEKTPWCNPAWLKTYFTAEQDTAFKQGREKGRKSQYP